MINGVLTDVAASEACSRRAGRVNPSEGVPETINQRSHAVLTDCPGVCAESDRFKRSSWGDGAVYGASMCSRVISVRILRDSFIRYEISGVVEEVRWLLDWT